MSLLMAIPCQCTLVSWGSWLSTVICSRSPAWARTSGPGNCWSYPHVETTRPPRSTSTGRGVNCADTTVCPGARRSCSSRLTRSDEAPTGLPVAAPEPEHAVRAPAPARSDPAKKDRRETSTRGARLSAPARPVASAFIMIGVSRSRGPYVRSERDTGRDDPSSRRVRPA